MSRIPSNPSDYPPPQQPMFYPNQGQPPTPGPPNIHRVPHYIQNPNPYPYGRNSPIQNGRGMEWDGVEGYQNAQAGPSRGHDPHQPYTQPRASPSGSTRLPGPPGAGWSSFHPNVSPMPPPPRMRMPGGHGVAVKLEDLVSHDRARVPNGRAVPPGPGGLTSMPLNTSQPPDPSRQTFGGVAADLNGAQQAGPSEFIKKLYKMLEEESAMYGRGKAPGQPRGEGAERGSVGWGRGGTSFVVWDMNEFTTKVLPQTFRHSNCSSFVRQLNKYGFSKIKHVDEETGQIKENVWEFQHPSFQAGGKADLDSIKRKAVVLKKGTEPGNETSPSGPRSAGPSTDEMGRLIEMENRVMGLEERLASALDEVQEARSRAMGLMIMMREVIGHLAAMEKGSPIGDVEPSPRMSHLFQLFDQAAQGNLPRNGAYPSIPLGTPTHAHSFGGPLRHPAPPATRLHPANGAHISPRTDASGSRTSGDGPSPVGSLKGSGGAGSGRPVSSGRSHLSGVIQEDQEDDVIEMPKQQHTHYDGEPLGVTPAFADTPAWLTKATTAAIPIYHRQSSDGAALRLMVEALGAQNGARFDGDSQDPLDSTPRPATGSKNNVLDDEAQQSPFGTLLIPPQSDSINDYAVRLRRSTTVMPHWTQTPRILVVEDDVVYRQLSSKFLEKFGCVTETVDDAQGAVEKMNRTKYDLVLMDIFFGPSMDGRKATSLIRQFDIYTPIISMTSNAEPQDVDSYLQSGMNDVLAKPFTKNGLFGILDKHLMHLKAIQLSAEVPRSVGVPPLSDQGVVDAFVMGAAQWMHDEAIRNPLAAMGWSDETYQMVLQQFMATGTMPDGSLIGGGAIGTNVVFGDSAGFNRKRSLELLDEEWSPSVSLQGPDVREVKRVKGLK